MKKSRRKGMAVTRWTDGERGEWRVDRDGKGRLRLPEAGLTYSSMYLEHIKTSLGEEEQRDGREVGWGMAPGGKTERE